MFDGVFQLPNIAGPRIMRQEIVSGAGYPHRLVLFRTQPLQEVIESTSFWRPFEQHRLKRFKRSFDALADATYNATDDVAALLRCKDQTGEMGVAVVESAERKHNFHAALLNSESVGEAIGILRKELLRHKDNLM